MNYSLNPFLTICHLTTNYHTSGHKNKSVFPFGDHLFENMLSLTYFDHVYSDLL